jgi:hypothetical protein
VGTAVRTMFVWMMFVQTVLFQMVFGRIMFV